MSSEEDTIRELRDKLEATTAQMEKWKQSVKVQLHEAELKNRLMHNESTELRAQLEKVSTDTAVKVRLQLTKEFQDRLLEKEQQWSEEVGQLRQEVQLLRDRLRSEEARVEELVVQQGAGFGAEEQVATLQAMLNQAKSEIRRYEQASAKYSEAMKDAQKNMDRTVQEAMATQRHKTLQLELAQQRITDLEHHNAELCTLTTRLEDESREREGALNTLFDEQHRQLFVDMKKENDTLQRRCEKLQQELQDKTKEALRLSNEISDNAADVESMKVSMAHAQSAADKAKSRVTELEAKLRDAYREITIHKVTSAGQAAPNAVPSSAVSYNRTTVLSTSVVGAEEGAPLHHLHCWHRLRGNWRRTIPIAVLTILVLLGGLNSAWTQQQEKCTLALQSNQALLTQKNEIVVRLEHCNSKLQKEESKAASCVTTANPREGVILETTTKPPVA